jgi:acetyl esterase/lipase
MLELISTSYIAVDYRLVNDAPHPAQLIDALSGYCHLTDVLGIPSSRIVIIGACAGGIHFLFLFFIIQ